MATCIKCALCIMHVDRAAKQGNEASRQTSTPKQFSSYAGSIDVGFFTSLYTSIAPSYSQSTSRHLTEDHPDHFHHIPGYYRCPQQPLTGEPYRPTSSCSAEKPVISFLSPSSATASVNLEAKAPFTAIQSLLDHLHAHLEDVAKLNAIYLRRGVVKTAALQKTESDQKFTIDLSAMRNSRIPETLR